MMPLNTVHGPARMRLFMALTLWLCLISSAEAATYYWTTWNSYNFDGTTHTLTGTITTGGAQTVTVTYTNTQGVAGYQLGDGTGGSTNYYSGGTDGAAGTSPYTSATVENRPDNVTIVRLSNAGTQTLTFSQNVVNLAFAFVSLNGNAFSFDRNFDLLSFGDPSDGGNDCGFFGCGTASKVVTGGSYPYEVSGTNEPHGTLHFSGAFNALTWTSGIEDWHGFTVGIAGTAAEIVTDTTPPTVTIDPAHGTTNVPLNANITITFDEEVRNLDDTPLTSANVDALITLKDSNATGADIPFDATIDATSRIITINPSTDFLPDQIIYVAIGASVEDTYGNAIAASAATITTGATLSTHDDPRTKKDVVGNIEAWSDMARRWARSNLDSVNTRLDWLRRNRDSRDKSHHGAHVRADDPVVDAVIRAVSGQHKRLSVADAAGLLQRYSTAPDQATDDAKHTLIDVAFSQLAQATQEALGAAVPGPAADARADHWAWWTQGEILVGRARADENTSRQRADDYQIFFGLDRSVHNDGRVGFALGLGQSSTEVGGAGSGVDSDNYALSGYASVRLPTAQIIEAALGYGRMQMEIVRIDGNQTLTGARDANQLFGMLALRGDPLLYGKLSVSPYGRLEASHTRLEEFSETGGNMALTFDRQTLNTTTVFIGTDLDYTLRLANARFRPFAKLEYGANANHKSDVDMQYVADTTDYRLTLAARSSSYWKTAIGFDYQIRNRLAVTLAYSRLEAVGSGHMNSLRLQAHVPLHF